MKTTLEKLLDYDAKESKYVLTALEYAEEYAEGAFMKGYCYGAAVGGIVVLLILVITTLV